VHARVDGRGSSVLFCHFAFVRNKTFYSLTPLTCMHVCPHLASGMQASPRCREHGFSFLTAHAQGGRERERERERESESCSRESEGEREGERERERESHFQEIGRVTFKRERESR
jgi:hypothetical protein